MMIVRLLGVVLFLGLGPGLRAHDPGLSTAHVTVRADAIVVAVTFAPADLRALKTPSPAPAVWIAGLFELRVGAVPQVARTTATEPAPESEQQFVLTFPRAEAGGAAELRALRLDELPPGHRQYVTVAVDGGPALAERLLFVREPAVTFTLPPRTGGAVAAGAEPPTTFFAFLKLGVEHIWTGYDHLLFLFALLVVCRSFKSIAAIITCFTLAHSTTLALATLNIVSLPSRITEPAIAASIVFVGVENLFRRGAEPPGRWALTFAFGLIHGFGFASVLRDLGVGEQGTSIVMPLFTFNAGVEIGQITIAAIVLPIVWRLRKNEKFLSRGVPALSAIVSLAGLYWLLERTVFA
jgi:hydrogenase/urease accessory protein HupE